MPQDILFAVDSTYVRPDLRRDLLKLAESLQRYPDTTVDIMGNTSPSPPTSHRKDARVIAGSKSSSAR